MAWKIKQEHVRDDDVVEPSEFRINANEYTSEINGYLDADNIAKSAVQNDLVKRGAFVEIIGQDSAPGFNYIFNHNHSGWQNKAYRVGNTEFGSDLMAVNVTSTSITTSDDLPDDRSFLPRSVFNPSSDGLVICEYSGFIQWSKEHLHPSFKAPVLASGTESQPQNYSWYAKQTKYFKMKAAYVLCSMWRLTVNGMSVAETGPIGNEYQAHPIYLCGVSPVLKGKDTAVQLEGRFVWFNAGYENIIEASSWAPLVEGATEVTWRRDCALKSSNLIVTFRKR